MPKLTAKSVDNAPAKPKQYLLSDGNGLNLQVNPDRHRYWIFRYRFAGRARRISLGPYPKVALQQARLLALDCRKDLSQGIDPGLRRRQQRQRLKLDDTLLFQNVAGHWYQSKVRAGRARSTLQGMELALKKDILPLLGHLSVQAIRRADCLKVQSQIEARGALNIAGKVRVYLREIFSQAVARGLCDVNPATELRSIAQPLPQACHHPYLLEAELPAFLQALSLSPSRFISTTAAWMTLWTASRPGMVRFARWDEIDFDKALWTIPAHRMKMRSEHRMPLCTQLVTLLQRLYQLTGRQEFLFPGSGPKHPTLSANTITEAFQLIGYKGKMVGHGARHTASTLLREHMWPRDMVEAQLAHREKGVAGEYNHAIYLKYRAQMMQWYADYLDALKDRQLPAQAALFEQRRNTTLFGLHQESLNAQRLNWEYLTAASI